MIRIKRKKNPTDEEFLKKLHVVKKKHEYEDGLTEYFVYDKDKCIGGIGFNIYKDYVTWVQIEKPYRRKGIASFLYKYVENDLDIKIDKPSPYLLNNGEKFWKNRLKKNPTDYKLLKDIKIKKLRIFEPIGRDPNRHYLEYKILLNNKQIGYAMMEENTNFVSLVEIHDAFQRSGLNTYLYNYIENDLNIKLVPSKSQSSDGKAFWKSRK